MTVTFPANSNIVPATAVEQVVFDFFTHRGDTMYRADDSAIIDYRIMGALEVRDGKICRYTDYFDTIPTAQAFAHLFDRVG
jgi:limonene-1,2-epoxide hydrolase